jgi:phosphoglycerol transferase MdoB-like AlkP superfamily enzyme
MHKYFKNVIPSEKNKYTGMFKGKNLIFITAEAFDTIAINENITPTLFKMVNNSFVFTNFYQPLYPVSTSDGEYMNLTGLIPKEGVWSLSKTSNNQMPYGIGNMFKKENYLTYAFHNYTYKYYDRHKSHPNLGFNYIGCGNGLEKLMNCKKWPNSDIEMFNTTTNYYINKNQPFMTYYLTVSGHLNYNFYGNNMAYKHKNEVQNLSYSDAIKAYYATQIELDKSLEYLLNELEKNQLLNDTLIIISPDHYPYGLTEKEINEVSDINRDDKFELYHTSLIMYNPLIEKTIVDKIVSSIDILPTIYNLYGIEYDSRLFIGKDIFSNQEHIVVLSDRSWITDKGKYNSVSSKFIKTTNEELEDNYINKINKIVNDKYKMSSLIIDNNYYSKVGLK